MISCFYDEDEWESCPNMCTGKPMPYCPILLDINKRHIVPLRMQIVIHQCHVFQLRLHARINQCHSVKLRVQIIIHQCHVFQLRSHANINHVILSHYACK